MSDDESADPFFSLKIEGDLRPRENNAAAFIDLDFGRGTLPYAPAARVGVSWSNFKNADEANTWYRRTKELFGEALLEVVREAMSLLLHEASNRALIEAGLVPFGKRAVLNMQLSATDKLLRQRLKMGAGRPPKWTAPDLSQAISEAMRALPKACRNYEKVAERLKEKHQGRAPKNGGSLKKMVRNLDIDWMKIKRDIEKGS